jgi:glycosyltransferase involved in cell wall biosynthesis
MAAISSSLHDYLEMTVNPRHVLFLIPTLACGGAQRVILTLLQHLDRSKFKLTLAVVDTQNAFFREAVPKDVEFIDMGCSRVRYALPRIVSLLWRRRPDVVFSTLGHLNLALAMLRPVLPRKSRYIARETTVVSKVIYQSYRWPWLWQMLYKKFYPAFDAIVCQSRGMMTDLVEKFNLSDKYMTLIYNPVDVNQIRSLASIPCKDAESFLENKKNETRTIQLIAAGRLVEEKGFDLLIEAMALLSDLPLSLNILGEGPLLGQLQQLANSREVGNRVRFIPFQSNPYPWFSRVDAFVLSSRYEGLPNVVLEALACGTPVISTPAPGGIREILENIPECVLAETISAKALAEAIKNWVSGPHKRISDKAIDPYRIQPIIEKYEKLLSQFSA